MKSPPSKHTHPWITIWVGLIVFVITAGYYYDIRNQEVIFHGTISNFEMYGWTVFIIGTTLKIWGFIRLKSLSKIWLLILVLFSNLIALYYFETKIKPMPSQFRFSLTNRSNINLSEMKAIGAGELQLDKLEPNSTINFALSNYEENRDIDLIYKIDNKKIDTLNLANVISNSCGFYHKINLRIVKGQLVTKY